ncbi:MAG: response regulator [Deltaproteobacteria bacterium]|nr:response regulator [Deltaproteobacteria bacterium]
MTDKQKIRVLLIEDDEDDYKIIKETLSEIQHVQISLEWVSEIKRVPEKIRSNEYDICLMDYRLEGTNGIDLMKDMVEKGFEAPFIFLTGYGDHEIDLLSMKSGAADYLEKGEIDPGILERSIRYSIERKRHINALRISEQRLHLLSAKLAEAQEDERKGLAREIHDGIGSNLVAIKYALESILVRMRRNKSLEQDLSIEQVLDYVKDAIKEAQRISSDLRPSVLDDMGLGASVRWICRRYSEIYPGIRIRRRLNPKEIDVPLSLKVVIFRVLQEAMNNVVKHSGADAVYLNIRTTDERLTMIIRDNGHGFSPDVALGKEIEGGVGLISMKERIEMSGGSLEISSEEAKGCVIKAVWPINRFLK